MKINVEKKAKKDIDKLPDKVQKKAKNIMIGILEVERIEEIVNCKRLRGNKDSYSIRFGKYRIGFKYEDERINIYRVLHRREIYSRFP